MGKLLQHVGISICSVAVAGLMAGCSLPTPKGLASKSPLGAKTALPASAEVEKLVEKQSPAPSTPLAALRRTGAALAGAVRPAAAAVDDPVRLSRTPGRVDSSLYYSAARLSESQQNLSRAVAQYQQALEVNPNDVRSLLGLARLFDRQADMERAEQYYLQAVQLEPNNPIVLNDLALCLARQRKMDEALSTFQRLIELQPDSARYRNNMATLLIEMGRAPEAFLTLAAVHPPAAAHYNAAFLMARRGLLQGAQEHLTYALQADPAFQPALQLR